jgi:CDP-paratose 2-epimerase
MIVQALPERLCGATVLVTGGAGFIGAHIALQLARHAPGAAIVALDNLRRRGSELNVARLRDGGVEFVHGDVRNPDDLSLPGRTVTLLIECSAEPSVAVAERAPGYAIQTNLIGTINCLELARQHRADVLFLSTSRVYPIAALNAVRFVEQETRFAVAAEQAQAGISEAGVREDFSLDGVRSIYGATKLASELLLHEYGASYGLRYVIDRLGVVAGPGQWGTGEQGVFTYWMARHYFGGELTYRGWGGTGKQVRDLLHVDDVWHLVRQQLERWDQVQGGTYNAGGGAAGSLSLCEATRLCQDIAGRRLPVGTLAHTDPFDVRIYQTDHCAVTEATGWQPSRDPATILSDTFAWIRANESQLAPLFRGR